MTRVASAAPHRRRPGGKGGDIAEVDNGTHLLVPGSIDLRASNGRPDPVRREKRVLQLRSDGSDETAAEIGVRRDEGTNG